MKVKRRNFSSPRSSSGGVAVISLQVGDCWLWSLIFQIQRYYSVVIITQEYYTVVPPALGFGGSALKKFFWDVCWPTVLCTHGFGLTLEFTHCISPIKEKHCNTAMYGMVLYCIVLETISVIVWEILWECEEEVQWSCCRLYPFIFLDANKRTRNFCVDIAHLLGEPHYICVSL